MDQPLTREQLQVVVHVANGYRIAEICELVYMSRGKVYKVLDAAKRRAGANTLPHLVSIVIASGVLEWTSDGDRALNDEEPTSLSAPIDGSSSADSPRQAA